MTLLTELNTPHLVLAASYPARAYRTRADSQEIAAAVKALLGALFRRDWGVIFGGHPTISPLVLMIAREFGKSGRVTIYQSSYFTHHISQATLSLVEEGFGQIEFVENHPFETPPIPGVVPDPTKCALSLTKMREAMINDPRVSGMVLVGGDTGLQEELGLFRKRLPTRPIIPLGFPGGIARDLLAESQPAPGMDEQLWLALRQSKNYLSLFSRVAQYLDTHRA